MHVAAEHQRAPQRAPRALLPSCTHPASCPISTGGGTRRVRSVRGAGGGGGHPRAQRPHPQTPRAAMAAPPPPRAARARGRRAPAGPGLPLPLSAQAAPRSRGAARSATRPRSVALSATRPRSVARSATRPRSVASGRAPVRPPAPLPPPRPSPAPRRRRRWRRRRLWPPPRAPVRRWAQTPPRVAPSRQACKGTRRVQLVRRDGRDVSTLYGREGGGGGRPLGLRPLLLTLCLARCALRRRRPRLRSVRVRPSVRRHCLCPPPRLHRRLLPLTVLRRAASPRLRGAQWLKSVEIDAVRLSEPRVKLRTQTTRQPRARSGWGVARASVSLCPSLSPSVSLCLSVSLPLARRAWLSLSLWREGRAWWTSAGSCNCPAMTAPAVASLAGFLAL